MTTNNHRGDRDSTIEDIHKIRARISDAFGGDIRAISEDARKRQQQSGRLTISRATSTKNRSTPSRE